MIKPIKIGMKVRVYGPRGTVHSHGEVMGWRDNGKIVLAVHPEYETLPLSQIDLFRDASQVVVLNPQIPIPWFV
jgi:hypothetical protein